MASATEAQARLGMPPDENRNEIDDGQCNKEEQDETATNVGRICARIVNEDGAG
jgi:hypothetical protein